MTAAFFDLDNTVVRGSSLIPFAYALVREGRISLQELAHFAWMNACFVARRTESSTHRDRVLERALQLVAGVPQVAVDDLCRRIVPGILRERLNAEVVSEVRRHQVAGHQTWLVTASPRELASELARALGMTGALGTEAQVETGVYTGRLVGTVLHGPLKADAVAHLARESCWDLGTCYAYSDSINDLPMLGLVGNAVVVNPHRSLRAVAQSRHWRVIDEAAGRRSRVSALRDPDRPAARVPAR